MLFEVAGLRVLAGNECEYVKTLCRDYETPDGAPDISVSLPPLPPREQSIELLRAVSEEMLKRDGFLIHSSAISFDGKGVLFTAPSGTGKSTHAKNWVKSFGARVSYINDDKPIVRVRDGAAFVYGTPWCGKHGLQTNACAPVCALVFLKRGSQNSIKRVSPDDIMPLVFDQIMRPEDLSLMDRQLTLLDAFLSRVPVFELYCTPDLSSAAVAFDGLKGVLK
ncbi:MAG: hypothetical protein IJS65_02045 [Clostridia bacterium]|nr:hypothetical protein [Clostridia bacterium]